MKDTNGQKRGAGILLALAVVFLASGLIGCVSWMAQRIVSAPGRDDTNFAPPPQDILNFAEKYGFDLLQFPVGPPAAELAVTIVPPRDYGMEYEFTLERGNGKARAKMRWTQPENLGPVCDSPRGTALLLPGAHMSRYTMLHWAMGLGEQGYQSILVDHRGHGDSTGRLLTFGAQEARDLQKLIASMQARGLITEPLVAVGVSMGAVTAMNVAEQVDGLAAIVAFEPFADAPEAIHGVRRGISPGWMTPFLSNARLDRAIDQASGIVGHDIRAIRPVESVHRVDAPVLFIHGQEDSWVPPRHSIELFMAKGTHADLWVIPGAGHMDLPMRYGELSERVFEWLDAVLTEDSATVTRGTREVSPEVSS